MATTTARVTPTSPRPRAPLFAAVLGVAAVAALAAVVMREREGRDEDRSIAVLPFDVVGGDTSGTAFILGVHGEIVTQLSRIASLSVASRASSSAYRGRTSPAHEIADELGVATLLTGSVQRAGGRVRLQVSLEDAERGRQIWTESYDRELTAENLFEIQGEVASQVANALRVQLNAGEAAEIARPATRSLAALELYHAGLVRWNERTLPGDSLVVRLMERTVALDSSFARAWGLLAQMRSWQLRQGVVFDTLPAWQAVQRTQELAPGSLDAILASGYYHYYARADYTRALSEFEAARQKLPGSAEIVTAIGLVLRRLGRHDDAVTAFVRAVEMDRRSTEVRMHLADSKISLGQFSDALDLIDQVLQLSPAHAISLVGRFRLLAGAFGDTTSAIAHARRAQLLLDPGPAAMLDQEIALLRRDWPAFERAAKAGQAGFSGNGLQHFVERSMVLRRAGDRAGARMLADSALRESAALISAAGNLPGDPFGTKAVALMQGAIARAAAGDSARAVEEGERAIASFNVTVDGSDGPFMRWLLALLYSYAGRTSDAIEQLRQALQVPMAVTQNNLRFNPHWDPLRGDPRFEQLVGR